MRHPFRIREIAAQAGLSEATVDRVLHNRPGVRASTAREVHQAIEDLHRQRSQLRIAGHTFMIDVVMQAPNRFSSAVRAALEAELPTIQPAVIRCRFHFREAGPGADLAETLDRIARRGTHGVILKAPDVPDITAAIGRVVAAGIPVVTLVTDVPDSPRSAYVGADNRSAGATAAYLVDQWLGPEAGNVLVTLSRSVFRGEEEREIGFRAMMRKLSPDRSVVEISETDGLDATMYDLVREALDKDPDIKAVYSIGGGNAAIVDAFEEVRRRYSVFIAHDLDMDNKRLLPAGRLSAVLYHDLRRDMRRACYAILRANRALPVPVGSAYSDLFVITPFNLPTGSPEST